MFYRIVFICISHLFFLSVMDDYKTNNNKIHFYYFHQCMIFIYCLITMKQILNNIFYNMSSNNNNKTNITLLESV